ncbi:MAG: molybdenum cofactor guanylyltransferase [Ilumatobacteraceae bacterium]|nr:molybdenum cofactor guanylyltransferase [Ilumatobacteraceae bacterium]
MGADKATLPLEGMPMAHRVRRALFDGGAGSVVLVGSGGTEEGAVPDRWPGEGPLAGIAAAVEHGAEVPGIEVVVVAACDQPDLSGALVADLAHALVSGPAEARACAVRTPDGRLQPFPSAWRTGAAAALVELVEAGERRADAAFGIGPVIEVAAPADLLADLDTPDDLRRWTARHQDGPSAPPVPGA